MGPEEIVQGQEHERRAYLPEDNQVEHYLGFAGPKNSSELFSSPQGLGIPLACVLVFLECWPQDKVNSLHPCCLYSSACNASQNDSGHSTSLRQLEIY